MGKKRYHDHGHYGDGDVGDNNQDNYDCQFHQLLVAVMDKKRYHDYGHYCDGDVGDNNQDNFDCQFCQPLVAV